MKEIDLTICKINKILEKTYNKKILSNLKNFAAFYKMDQSVWKKPILVSGVDGVGTKIRLAINYKKYDVIGKDCFAMCINDILCHGAIPLFFLDYLSCNMIDASIASKIIEGAASSCKESNTCFIGGETAEMKGFYKENDYDISGFCVGMVEEDHLINGKKLIQEGDILIGLPSSGIHSNGFSLIRNFFYEKDFVQIFENKPLYETLLIPTRVYYIPVHYLLKKFSCIHGIAHITGGGISHNLSRIIPDKLSAIIYKKNVPIHSIFSLIQKKGHLSDKIMWETFNMGIGMIFVVSYKYKNEVLETLRLSGENPRFLGNIVKGETKVLLQT
ncbi:phosphoribosylformylglycinamidine cyclo-ligase [Blattabacterium cuenoti]|uniref:phosphoribosylformylglycinamidine cyclo-ligase n=1 Tax=Blattabacterium cuenoti TaxID=1653831 RepID=UPI00163C90D9|nr:phosphoribosylformylglycinamidine cyclo-ligase [Blattabacterium cuenoti]